MGLRLIKAACVESSTNFTCIELFPEIGQGVGGLKSAPLYLIMNSIPPSQTLAQNRQIDSLGKILSEEVNSGSCNIF